MVCQNLTVSYVYFAWISHLVWLRCIDCLVELAGDLLTLWTARAEIIDRVPYLWAAVNWAMKITEAALLAMVKCLTCGKARNQYQRRSMRRWRARCKRFGCGGLFAAGLF